MSLEDLHLPDPMRERAADHQVLRALFEAEAQAAAEFPVHRGHLADVEDCGRWSCQNFCGSSCATKRLMGVRTESSVSAVCTRVHLSLEG